MLHRLLVRLERAKFNRFLCDLRSLVDYSANCVSILTFWCTVMST
ncbi:hypothetical protein TcasGA2_TC034526 [Tribolium castaneum]|uniref:Uncharacterized protein n=1 Tax=Tribolium castaneum TaxID=7070 RepID=A0A139WPD5_TRICA|nr:hypothetical protein TcasGA2_TC034526 [Tribolium castaneum]